MPWNQCSVTDMQYCCLATASSYCQIFWQTSTLTSVLTCGLMSHIQRAQTAHAARLCNIHSQQLMLVRHQTHWQSVVVKAAMQLVQYCCCLRTVGSLSCNPGQWACQHTDKCVCGQITAGSGRVTIIIGVASSVCMCGGCGSMQL